MSTSRAPVLNQRCLNPVPCSGGAGGLHCTREAAAGKGRAISWLQELNTKGPTRYLNKLIKQICFLPLFRTDCTVQDKEMTLVPVSRMTWMYNLIWLVGKAESQGQARLWGPKPPGFQTRTLQMMPAHFSFQGWEPGEAGAHPVWRISECRARITRLLGQMPIHQLWQHFS